MSGFGFTEAQEMFRRQVKDLAQREFGPQARELAKLEKVPRDIIKKLGEAELLGIALPEKYGGQEGNLVSLGIAMEELAKVSYFAGFYVLMAVGMYTHFDHMSDEVKEDWLCAMVRGERVCCWAITEPGGGSDATAMRSTAVREGNHYILSGEKCPISFSTDADAALLLAKTEAGPGARGITCFLVQNFLTCGTLLPFAVSNKRGTS